MKKYKNANVFLGNNMQLEKNMTLIVDGGKLVHITTEQYEDCIDLHGDYVIPAFVNAHCHLGDTGAKELGVGLTLEDAVVFPNGLKHKYLASISKEILVETIRHGLLEMLRNGIAVAADYREGGLAGVLALREAQKGLPILVKALGRPAKCLNMTDKEFENEIRSISEVADGFGMGGIDAVSPERMGEIRQIAKNQIFSIHISEGRNDCTKSVQQYGKSEVERAFELNVDLMVHLTHTDEKDRRILEENKIPIVCCPRTNLILGDGFPEIDLFTKNGISWGLGSDNMMFTNPNMFREMDVASRVIRGLKEVPNNMPYEECLKAATLGGAMALKMDNKYGTLEEGKSASFIAISSDSINLTYSHDMKSTLIHRVEPGDIDYFILDGMDVIVKKEFLFS